MAGAKAYIPPTAFNWPVSFTKLTTFTGGIDSTQTTANQPALRMHGVNINGQIQETLDYLGNPIESANNDGGFKVYGDRVNANPPGDVFNSSFQSMTNVNDHVVTNAAGIRLGHGATQNVAIFVGVGAPSASNPVSTGVPPNGSIYFRSDGTASNFLYQVRGGAWVPLVV